MYSVLLVAKNKKGTSYRQINWQPSGSLNRSPSLTA